MGLYTVFTTSLAEFAEKQIKFKQAKLHTAALASGEISQQVALKIEEGACAAYVCMWLADKLMPWPVWGKIGARGKDTKLTEKGRNIKSSSDTGALEVVSYAVRPFASYSDRFDLGDTNSIKKLGADLDVYLSNEDEPIWGDDIVALATKLMDKKEVGEDSCYFYLAASVKDSTTGAEKGSHALGFCHIRNKNTSSYYFFDPNVGDYKLKTQYAGQCRSFFVRYQALIAEHFKWKFGPVRAIHCSLLD